MNKNVARGLGSSVLVAATIVSGLSFGSAAATAAPSTNARPGSLVGWTKPSNSTTNNFHAYYADSSSTLKSFTTTSFADAVDYSPSVVIPNVGSTDQIELSRGRCLAVPKTLYDGSNNSASAAKVFNCDDASTAPAGWATLFTRTDDSTFDVKGTGGHLVAVGSTVTNAKPGVGGYNFFGDATGLYGADVQADGQDDAGRTASFKGTNVTNGDGRMLVNGKIAPTTNHTWRTTVSDLAIGENTITFEFQLKFAGEWRTMQTETRKVTIPGSALSVNAPVFSVDVDQLATLSGTAHQGAKVVIEDTNGREVATAQANDTNGGWSTPITAPDKAGVYELHVSQIIDGASDGDVQVDVDYGAGVTIGSPADGAEHTGGPLVISGKGQDGAVVKVRERGQTTVIGTDSVSGNGDWTITTSALSAGEHVLEVSQKSKGGNTTTQTVTVNPGKSEVVDPAGSVSFDKDVSKKATVSGTGADGATIKLFDAATDKQIGTAQVAGGTWRTTIDAIGVGSHTIRIEQTGIDGTQTATTTADFGQAATITSPTPGKVTPGMVAVSGNGQTGAAITIKAGSKTVNTTVQNGTFSAQIEIPGATEPATITVEQRSKGNLRTTTTVQVTGDGAQQLVPVTITGPNTYVNGKAVEVTGTASPYATVDISNQWNTIKTVTADKDGNWSFWRGFGPDVLYTLTAKQTLTDGQTSTSAAATLNPEGSNFNAPVAITGPSDGLYNPTSGGNRVTGTAASNATVEISSQWGVIKTVKANAMGNWEFYRGFGPDAVYKLTAKQTRVDGTTSTSAVFTLSPAASQTSPVAITGPADGYQPTGATHVTGTASPNATVVIKHQWGTAATVTADANGKWDFFRGFGPNVTYTLTAEQTRTDGTTTTSAPFTLAPKK